MNKLNLREGNRCQLPVMSCPLTANRQPTTVNPRRYFYPSLEQLPYIDQNTCPIAQDLAKRVLCLPLYVDLTTQILALIVKQVNL